MNSKWNKFKTWVKGIFKNSRFPHITYWDIVRFGSCIRKLATSSIILYVLAHFVPELRIKLPYLYLLTDKIMDVFNVLFKWFVYLLQYLGVNF